MHLRIWLISTPIFIISCMALIPLSSCNPRISEAGIFCSQTQTPSRPDIFIKLFHTQMIVLLDRLDTNDWGNYSFTNSSSNMSIYSLIQCHGDLSHQDCLQCYAASRTRLPHCIPAVAGRLFLDGCFMRYDSQEFSGQSVDPELDTRNCNTTLGEASEPGFGESVGDLVDRLSESAVAHGGYAVRGNRGVFGLAQCWGSLSRDGCRECLDKATREVKGCLPSREGRALNAGCYLRYSTQRFYGNNTGENQDEGGSRPVLLAVLLSVAAFCLLCLSAGFAAYRRWKKRKQERKNLGRISYSYNKSGLNFKYETLEKATNYFDNSRKLGQGGAGSVYRGTLSSGKTVAVKRLFFSSRQWVDEFFNEINLISGISHKNLVKLLGCSIEGPESLLVYEFVPNKSLEHYLFDKKKVKVLNWQERYNIIVGTAEGIAFLHGGSELRIIHRDIKCSNVILDENLDAKIADFGLARLFAPDKTHLTTGIAGTLGYMAPEYLVKGHLTEKADVYSFGVLVIEIVCGRRNNAFEEDSGSLLQTVWTLYKTDRFRESIDPCLEAKFPEMEAFKVLRIGLLCAQASPPLRPSMAEVVQMLTDENYEIPEANQPPFINTASLSASLTGSSYSSNSFAMKAVMGQEASNASAESSSIHSSSGLLYDHLPTKLNLKGSVKQKLRGFFERADRQNSFDL